MGPDGRAQKRAPDYEATRGRGTLSNVSATISEPPLSVVVFAVDEEENVESVLSELREWLDVHEPGSEIVFVDDGSRDATSERALSVLAGTPHQLLRHETNRGIGAALKTGVPVCRARWVTFMPADGQIAPEAIGTLRRATLGGAVDVAFSIYADRDDGLSRKVLSWGVRALVRTIHGVRLSSDGPYLFRRELFRPDSIKSDTFFLNFEFPIRLLLDGRASDVVVIHCRPRRAGRSKSARLRTVGLVARELLAFRVRRALER